MKTRLFFLVSIGLFFSGCEVKKDNPVYSSEKNVSVEYVGIGFFSHDGTLANQIYFEEKFYSIDNTSRTWNIFKDRDPFSRDDHSDLYECCRDSSDIHIELRADTYPFSIDSLRLVNSDWEISKVRWEWRFWHLREFQGNFPYNQHINIPLEWEPRSASGTDSFVSLELSNENGSIVSVGFPCPDYPEDTDSSTKKDSFSIWRIGAVMFDANGDSLELPDSYNLETKSGLIRGVPIRTACKRN
jgi:hypothetical protein